MGVRPCVIAKLPVLRPWFWNLILLNLAPASCYFIAFLVGGLRCNASRLLRQESGKSDNTTKKRHKNRKDDTQIPQPDLRKATFTASSQKLKNAHRRYSSCAGSQSKSFLGFCAPSSSAVSVAGVGVLLQWVLLSYSDIAHVAL